MMATHDNGYAFAPGVAIDRDPDVEMDEFPRENSDAFLLTVPGAIGEMAYLRENSDMDVLQAFNNTHNDNNRTTTEDDYVNMLQLHRENSDHDVVTGIGLNPLI